METSGVKRLNAGFDAGEVTAALVGWRLPLDHRDQAKPTITTVAKETNTKNAMRLYCLTALRNLDKSYGAISLSSFLPISPSPRLSPASSSASLSAAISASSCCHFASAITLLDRCVS